jgi:hypothetical protein
VVAEINLRSSLEMGAAWVAGRTGDELEALCVARHNWSRGETRSHYVQ